MSLARPRLIRSILLGAMPPRQAYPCPRSTLSLSTPHITSTLLFARGYASKKKLNTKGVPAEEDETTESGNVSKGKKGKGKLFAEESQVAVANEAFDLKLSERNMGEAIDKLRVALKVIVGRVGRLSPGWLIYLLFHSVGLI